MKLRSFTGYDFAFKVYQVHYQLRLLQLVIVIDNEE